MHGYASFRVACSNTHTASTYLCIYRSCLYSQTGWVCREVVKDLLAKGVSVKAFVRDTKKAGRVLPVAAEAFEGDLYQYADVMKAVDGVDAIICTASTNTPSDPLGPFNIDYNVCPPSAVASNFVEVLFIWR